MFQRILQRELEHALLHTPAAALVGARQCGKTTQARALGGHYFDLEQEPERLRLDLQWDRLIAGKELIILDEAQSWPDVFPRLRGAIDADRQHNGRFLLLGSVSPSLMVKVSESLAGRLALLELTPFLWPELDGPAQQRLWFCGGYPDGGALNLKSYPRWQNSYLTLLAQRDLPHWGLPAKPQVTSRLMKMLAALTGQNWNASRVGQSLGLDYKTINSYLDFLAGAFLIRRLLPYQTNVKKRLVKTPKVYWRDSGLLHALMNVPDARSLLSQPWVGASWEGFVIEQAIGVLSAAGIQFEPFYFRTSDQHELDLVLDFGGKLWAVEIKLTSAPSSSDLARLEKAADLIGAKRRFLVSRTAKPAQSRTTLSCDLDVFLKTLQKGP